MIVVMCQVKENLYYIQFISPMCCLNIRFTTANKPGYTKMIAKLASSF